MKKRFVILLITLLIASMLFSSCTQKTEKNEQCVAPAKELAPMLVAAASSLEYAYTHKLIPMFEEENKDVFLKGVFDSSGKLQTQIKEGLQADVFMAASPMQMNALIKQGIIDKNSVVDLLENKIVLIAPANSDTKIASFEDILQAESIALGDPKSVPAGQYAKEALESLGIYEKTAAKASFGTNVTEVLNWVVHGSADVGIVYATDAAATPNVKVLAAAPLGSLAQKIIYPVGIVSNTKNIKVAQKFIEFLQTPQAIAVFETYGFISNIL